MALIFITLNWKDMKYLIFFCFKMERFVKEFIGN
jgi:hypothetical protein